MSKDRQRSFAIVNFYSHQYNGYFRPFYESAKRHFFPDSQRTFFIFTDNPYVNEPDIVRVPIKDGRPSLRFQQLEQIIDELSHFDHFVLFNGNSFFLQRIDVDSHPEDEVFLAPLFGSTCGLAHQSYLCVSSDRNSPTYIDRDSEDISTYYRGGLWGGSPEMVIPMIRHLAEQGRSQQLNDELQINRYFVTHKTTNTLPCLDHRYIWSGMWGNNPHFDLRIVMADKCGAYGALRAQAVSDQEMQTFASGPVADGTFYIGPGSWPSDVLRSAPEPPPVLIDTPVMSLSNRARYLTRSVLEGLLPPLLYKALRKLNGLRARMRS